MVFYQNCGKMTPDLESNVSKLERSSLEIFEQAPYHEKISVCEDLENYYCEHRIFKREEESRVNTYRDCFAIAEGKDEQCLDVSAYVVGPICEDCEDEHEQVFCYNKVLTHLEKYVVTAESTNVEDTIGLAIDGCHQILNL